MYWNSLSLISGGTKKPIYTWNCFENSNIDELRIYIQDITEQLHSYDEISDNIAPRDVWLNNKIYAILFMIRCALISRCSDDWDLTINPKYVSGLNWNELNPSVWRSLISTAENALGRAPLTEDLNGGYYCTRIVVESGIPLNALHNPKSKIVEGLRSIWTFRSNISDFLVYNKAIHEFESTGILKQDLNNPQILPLPGGKAGHRAFFDMGFSLLTRAVNASKEANGYLDSVAIFSNLGFKNPSKEAIDYIFGSSSIPQSMPAFKSNLNSTIP